MNWLFFTAIVLLGLVFSSVSLGYSGGSGTPEAPYQIANKADLLALAETVEDYNKCFILTADIDMQKESFTTAIIRAANFTGTFDGNNHKITRFTIFSYNGKEYLGLFSRIDSGLVKNLGLENFNITGWPNSSFVGGLAGTNQNGSIINCYSNGNVYGSSSVGGLVGYSVSGSISSCHSTGTVNGYDSSGMVGGLVGWNHSWSSINNCYSTSDVSGSSYSAYLGGLVGSNSGTINNCYSTGSVDASSSSDYLGGLVGKNEGNIINSYSRGGVSGASKIGGLVGYNFYNGSISNCYSTGMVDGTSDVGGLVGKNDGGVISSFWNTQTSDQVTSAGGTGKTTAQMKMLTTFTSAGWDFIDETANGTCNYWYMPPGAYPAFSTFNGYILPEPPGSGTEEDPYIIADANDLGTVWFRPLAHYVLASDINLSDITWSIAVMPAFSGVFDGNGFSINNLFINGGGFLGLFGRTYADSQVKNLGLENCTISGTNHYAGGLVGQNCEHSSISNCYASGAVSNLSDYTGGLAGEGTGQSIISRCYAMAAVSGASYTGGLVGNNFVGGNVNNCYATGNVSGSSKIGGLAGYNNSAYFSNCYSTGIVSGASHVGGLVGSGYDSSISSCFFIITSGPDNGYGTPLTDEQMKQQASFINWDFFGETANGTEDIWRMCTEGIHYPLLWWQFNPVDFTCPDGVEINDLAILCEQWLLKELSADVWPDGGDGIVNFFDWAVLANQWQTTIDFEALTNLADQWLKTGASYYIADIAPDGGDGIVNMLDFAVFANNWLQEP